MSLESGDAGAPLTPEPPSAAAGRFDVFDVSLKELVVRSDVSGRLQQAVLNFHGRSEIHTIRDYVEAGKVARVILMRDFRNFGRKTADELDALVRSALPGWDPVNLRFEGELGAVAGHTGVGPLHVDTGTFDPVAVADRSLEESFGSQTLGEVLAGEFMSARLTRALLESDLPAMSFVSVMRDDRAAEAALRRVRGVGRLTVAELRDLCERRVSKRLLDGGATSPTSTPEEGDDGSGDAQSCACRRLRLVLATALDSLTQKETEVLERRYGIEYERPETLEEVGASFDVTRERIRQIEGKALKRMLIKAPASVLSGVVDAYRPTVWSEYGSPIVAFADLASFRKALDPYVALALSVLDVGLEDWLDSTALRLAHGWFHDHAREADVAAATECLRAIVSRGLLPSCVGRRGNADLEICTAAAKLVLGLYVEAGYLVLRRPGPRLSRAIHLHAVLSSAPAPRPLDRLVADYRSRRPLDPCSERDALIVMEAAPHLFIRVVDDRWYALGAGGVASPVSAAPPVGPLGHDDRDSTIHTTLVEALCRRGPSRFSELRDEVVPLLPPNLSINSIGPMLLLFTDAFLRLLPGVYALHGQVPDEAGILTGDVPYLLTETQARFLATARYAGEPWDAFVLWSPAAEYRLCRWGRFKAASDVYRSLLSVASIDAWPVDDDEKAEWRRLAAVEGRYTLQVPIKPIAYRLPDLDRVLAACIHVRRDTGDFNWMVANRVEGRRIDAALGIGLVAVLIAADALVVPDAPEWPWLRRHVAGHGLEALLDELSAELNVTGALVWDGPAGSRLRARILKRIREPIGWLDGDRMRTMMDDTAVDGVDVGIDADDAELLMVEAKRRSDAQRREATLQWLLAG